jgi:hypothetical protein
MKTEKSGTTGITKKGLENVKGISGKRSTDLL